MGQYYCPYLKDGNGKVTIVGQSAKFEELYKNKASNAFDYYYGVKLMEHSWVGTKVTNTVSSMLYHNPQELVWVGDYSDEYDTLCPRDEDGEFENVYNFSEEDAEFDVRDKVCLDHTKKQYFIFSTLPKMDEPDEWVVFPLSLLTASGNGKGGGDYFAQASKELVGTWAHDIVEIVDAGEIPEGYTEIFPKFME